MTGTGTLKSSLAGITPAIFICNVSDFKTISFLGKKKKKLIQWHKKLAISVAVKMTDEKYMNVQLVWLGK